MDPQAKEIFLDAMELPSRDRGTYVEERCEGNSKLREEVRGLLRAGARADAFPLGKAVADLAGTPSGEQQEAAALALGGRIGPYVLRRQLGEGGFGVVYLADQELPIRRTVAIKLLRQGLDNRGVLARFEIERQALARMDHPGICKVLDAGTAPDGRSYFVMEYVDGDSIVSYCERHELSLVARLRLVGSVCDAVQHAHQKGVVHRDLKPSNVLVATVDGRPSPKVIDFGIAKATDEMLTDTPTLTHDGQLLGTPAYMSPEQAAGSTDVDTRSDVYALGTLLYELLTGGHPFEFAGRSPTEAMRMVREEEPVRPSQRLRATGASDTSTGVGTIPRDLDWIVMRCLEKDRNRRYATANALHADLERLLRSQPVEAAPPSRWYTLRKLARRHRVLVATCAAILAALLLGVAGTGYGLVQANRARTGLAKALHDSEDETKRARDAEELAAREWREAQRQRRIAEEVVAFLTEDLLSAVLPSTAPGRGREITMREVLDEASRRLDRDAGDGGRFASEPAVEATIRETIGDVYRHLDDQTEAEVHLRRALELHETLREPTDPVVLIAACKLASTLRTLGRAEESRSLIERFVDLQTISIEDASAEVLVALRQLALLRQRDGLHGEAVRIFELALGRSQELLGVDDRGTGYLRNGLAVSLATLGRSDEAEELFREDYEIARRRDGPRETDTVLSGANLGAFLLSRGRLERAEEVLLPVLEALQDLLGPDHEKTRSVRLNVAILDYLEGRHERAIESLEELIDAWEASAGESSRDRLSALLHLSRIHRELGELAEAEAILVEVRERVEDTLPPAHPFRSTVAQDLASVWMLMGGRDEELEALLRSTYRDDHALRGPDDPSTLRSQVNLGVFLGECGQIEEALELLVDAQARSVPVFGPEDAETLLTESDLARLYLRAGRIDDAFDHAEHALRLAERVLAGDSEELGVMRLRLGLCLKQQGRDAAAESELGRARQELLQHREPGDPDLGEATRALEELAGLREAHRGASSKAEG